MGMGIKKIYMRDDENMNIEPNSYGIINLDDGANRGTHWACWIGNYYCDPFGISPPIEVEQFSVEHNGPLNLYNEHQFQKVNDPPICGYLCVMVINWWRYDKLSIKEIDEKIREIKV